MAGPPDFESSYPCFQALSRDDFMDLTLLFTSHCVAKAAGARENIPHISYIHTPMRYIWDQWEHYAPSSSSACSASPVRFALQRWDIASSQRSGLRLLANSNFVARRIDVFGIVTRRWFVRRLMRSVFLRLPNKNAHIGAWFQLWFLINALSWQWSGRTDLSALIVVCEA